MESRYICQDVQHKLSFWLGSCMFFTRAHPKTLVLSSVVLSRCLYQWMEHLSVFVGFCCSEPMWQPCFVWSCVSSHPSHTGVSKYYTAFGANFEIRPRCIFQDVHWRHCRDLVVPCHWLSFCCRLWHDFGLLCHYTLIHVPSAKI
jgi:hypothetical protein